MQELLQEIQKLPGFKITGSHFRIGSKLHISDFYYAKRFFQNSFFASRFAFMLTREILGDLDNEKRKLIKKGGLTLIGYGLYSELLLSLTEKFLKSSAELNTTRINHNLVPDTEKLVLVKTPSFHEHVLIIVPIASTFSTSVKIEFSLQGKKTPAGKPIKVWSPHYNILHICETGQTTKLGKIEREFGWEAKDPVKREVRLKVLFEKDAAAERTERYFLSLPTTWQLIQYCSECFPEIGEGSDPDLLREKPLFDTDKTAVTPNIIFDFPRGREIPEEDRRRRAMITPAMVKYGHHWRNDHHFIYSVNTELFLQENLGEIITWLQQIKRTPAFRKEFPEYEHVLIASSCHYSNAGFINLVNETLFSSAANIIHYDPANDYIQNFEMIYGNEIEAADKILFVDDSLKSARTFIKIDDFIQQTLSARNKERKPIRRCILLLNKAQAFTIKKVMEKLDRSGTIHAFANMNLFTSLSHDEESSLIVEEKRYSLLIQDSLLDSLKVHFHKQLQKLSTDKQSSEDPRKTERHLAMLEATHRVYDYFSDVSPDRRDESRDIDRFLDVLWQKTASPIRYEYKHSSSPEGLPPQKAALLKVLTQSPFTQHEPLRKIVFKCVVKMLDRQVDSILARITASSLRYEHFKDLKFLMRRAGLMNSNYLISEKFIGLIEDLYSPGGLPGLKAMLQAETDKVNRPETNGLFKESYDRREIDSMCNGILNFPIFYCAQVKELLLQNEARSLRLEKLLQKKPGGSRAFQQIVRILKEENAVLMGKAVEAITDNEEWKNLEIDYYTSGRPVKEFLELPKVKQHHKYKLIEEFCRLIRIDEQVFESFLMLKHFLSYEHTKPSHVPLVSKNEFIYTKLTEIFRNCNSRINNNVGFFMIIRDSEKNASLIIDRNEQLPTALNRNNWNNEADAYFQEFLNGIPDETGSYRKAIVELIRNDIDQCWNDLYDTAGPRPVTLSYRLFPEQINRVMMVRLSKRIKENEEAVQGVIGFYFSSKSDTPSINEARMLLLLRESISDFVVRHHQNNEYRDWQIAETTRHLALLSGHGKDMMRRLAEKEGERFREIAIHMENLQTFILVNEVHRKTEGYKRLIDQFNNFYHSRGVKQIDSEYVKSIGELADSIYRSPQVEIAVDCTPEVTAPDNIKFAFDKRILDLILFELIINAKKNRWVFKPGEGIIANNPDQDGGKKIYTANDLHIAFIPVTKKGDSKMRIEVSNTGPYYGDERGLEKLNKRHSNIKDEDVIAGTALIKTIVIEILNGTVQFSTKQICRKNNFGQFKVAITLNEMVYDKSKAQVAADR